MGSANCIRIALRCCWDVPFFRHLHVWVTEYPEDYDPKNIDYVLWTHGLNRNMNLDDALAGMAHDAWSVRLVKGLSKEQLCNSPDAVGQLGIHPDEKEVVFLRDSDWMVILENGRAVDLVLCKGY